MRDVDDSEEHDLPSASRSNSKRHWTKRGKRAGEIMLPVCPSVCAPALGAAFCSSFVTSGPQVLTRKTGRLARRIACRSVSSISEYVPKGVSGYGRRITRELSLPVSVSTCCEASVLRPGRSQPYSRPEQIKQSPPHPHLLMPLAVRVTRDAFQSAQLIELLVKVIHALTPTRIQRHRDIRRQALPHPANERWQHNSTQRRHRVPCWLSAVTEM